MSQVSPTFKALKALAFAAGDIVTAHRFRTWGFGEEMALWGLLETSWTFDDPKYQAFVEALVGKWLTNHATWVPADHVAPGSILLELHRSTGNPAYLATALHLGQLYRSFPRMSGVHVHRPDLEAWKSTIWVDCLAIDAPFLFRLARATGEEEWADLGWSHLDGYLSALEDSISGLFWHGFDAARRVPTGALWGRGNGWALMGIVQALEHAPADGTVLRTLQNHLDQLAHALAAKQDRSGGWHTVLDDLSSPLEASVAAFYAGAMLRAFRLGLLDASAQLEASAQRALEDVISHVQADGTLAVSDATPIGPPSSYADRPLGVYPWGQGPALLALAEAAQRLRPSKGGPR